MAGVLLAWGLAGPVLLQGPAATPNRLLPVIPVTGGTWWDEALGPGRGSREEMMVKRLQRLEPPRSRAGPDSPGLAFPRLPGGFQGRKRDREVG